MIDEKIGELRPYFYSLREIKGQACLDLLIPLKWKYQIFNFENINVKKQDTNETKTLISLISILRNEDNVYDEIFKSAKQIIKYNIEEEEKHKLFEEKMNELKEIFMKSDLDNLKNIKFTSDDRQTEMVGIGNREGRENNPEPQIENNPGDKESE